MSSLDANTIDRKMCKVSADAFFDVACFIESVPEYLEFKGNMLSPYSVNLMLSCELYYKYLLLPSVQQIHMRRFKTHSIESLHQLLWENDSETADRIKELYYLECGVNPPLHSFEEVLHLNANNFEEFRYLFERNKRKVFYSTDISSIARALRQVSDNY